VYCLLFKLKNDVGLFSIIFLVILFYHYVYCFVYSTSSWIPRSVILENIFHAVLRTNLLFLVCFNRATLEVVNFCLN
jgi:hypothetical protein